MPRDEPMRYMTGEEILDGDRVLFHGHAASIEFVANDGSEPETAWYFETHGAGIMVLDPEVSGRTYVSASDVTEYEDLEFVARAE